MALLYFEGFEGYTNFTQMMGVSNDIIASIDGNPNYDVIDSIGRNGRGYSNNHYNGHFDIVLANPYTTFIMGFACKVSTGTPTYYSRENPIWSFSTLGGFNENYRQLGFYMKADREVEVWCQDPQYGSLLGTTSGINLGTNQWRYIEIKFTIDNSAGEVIVRSDQSVVLSVSGVDTQKQGSANIQGIRLKACYSNIMAYYDDLYMCDATGSKNNNFLGDVKVICLRPDSAGTYSQFTPSAGSNYENVDDSYGHDSDTTYNEADTIGYKDTYNLEAATSVTGEIKGIRPQIVLRKTDVGATRARIITKAGSTEELGSRINVSDSYTFETEVYEDNPDDSAAWEVADLNSLEVGVVLASVTTTTTT